MLILDMPSLVTDRFTSSCATKLSKFVRLEIWKYRTLSKYVGRKKFILYLNRVLSSTKLLLVLETNGNIEQARSMKLISSSIRPRINIQLISTV